MKKNRMIDDLFLKNNSTKILSSTLTSFIVYFVKKYRWSITCLIILAALSGAYGTINAYLTKVLIDQLTKTAINEENFFRITFWPAVLFMLNLEVHNTSWSLMKYINIRTAPKLKSCIIEEMFSHTIQHSLSFFQDNLSGSISNKIYKTAENIELIIYDLGPFIFRGLVQLVIALITMYFVNIAFSIMLLSWVFIFLSVSLIFSNKIKQLSNDYEESHSIISGKLSDSIINASNVILFAQKSFEKTYLREYLHRGIQRFRLKETFLLKIWVFQGFSITMLIGGMVLLLIHFKSKNAVTIGDFSLIISLSLYVTDNVWYITQQVDRVNEAIGQCVNGIKSVIIPHEILDIPEAKTLKVTNGEIAFHEVSFNYAPCSNLFENRSIIIPGKQKIGLVGYSGSGKTTFVNLIVRLYDVSHGYVTIDNQNISQITQKSLRENISFIPQEPILFHRSIMENIRYGKINATDEEVIMASKKAHAHEFIILTSDGYNSVVGERGVKLSGGQRQRISIARAILKNAPILILDEATSALDSINEEYIQDSLEELGKNRTVIIIAHRLSTLLKMDRILVFDNGRVVEDGTHAELIAQSGLYSLFWKMQVNGLIPDQDLIDASKATYEIRNQHTI